MVAGASLLFGACGDYLDITPKGATTFSNLTDLDKKPNAPQCFPILFDDPIAAVCYRPSHGVRSNIQAQEVFSLFHC